MYPKEQVEGGDAKENASITKGILDGTITGAKRDIVILNTAVALLVNGSVHSTEEGIVMAKEVIDSAKALSKLNEIIEVSNNL